MQLENDWKFYDENVKQSLESFKNDVSLSIICLFSRFRVGEQRDMRGRNVFYSIWFGSVQSK